MIRQSRIAGAAVPVHPFSAHDLHLRDADYPAGSERQARMSGGEFETVGTYGLMAEFDSPQRLITACEAARKEGLPPLTPPGRRPPGPTPFLFSKNWRDWEAVPPNRVWDWSHSRRQVRPILNLPPTALRPLRPHRVVAKPAA